VKSLSQKKKVDLKIDWATHEAAKYACEHWHYSKLKPAGSTVHFGVWENGKFIGVVLYGRGVAPNLMTPYGLNVNQGCELTRVALTEHKTEVSRIVSITLKILKKTFPGLRLVISFADPFHKHHGGIYQAGNWVYLGTTSSTKSPVLNGKIVHARTLNHLPRSKREKLPIKWIKVPPKHRYGMPLDEGMKQLLDSLSRPFPTKCATSIGNDASDSQSEEGGVNPTVALQSKT
jgi:hypothetical protein